MESAAFAVREYLARKGWIDPAAAVDVVPLSGGVSNDVWKIKGDGFCWVMKKALPKLRVSVDWYSDVGRIEREQEAMSALEPLLAPGTVPRIVHRDPEEHAYVMICAPDGAECWKDRMMAGRMEIETAAAAGRLLRRMHDATRARKDELRPSFADLRFFDELRIDPFHRFLSAKFPEISGAISRLVDELTSGGECLVHGDYSPKNILVLPDAAAGERSRAVSGVHTPGGGTPGSGTPGGEGSTGAPGDGGSGTRLILLDYEVAHWGNPVFDQAYCCGHLMLKGWTLGQERRAAEMIESFLRGYGGPCPGLVRHLGLMLLARVDGKSTVSYITDSALKEAIRSVGRRWVAGDEEDPSASVREAFKLG